MFIICENLTSLNISSISFSSSLSATEITNLRILPTEGSSLFNQSRISQFFIDLLRVDIISLDNVHAENIDFLASLLKIDTSFEISINTLVFKDVKFEPQKASDPLIKMMFITNSINLYDMSLINARLDNFLELNDTTTYSSSDLQIVNSN